MWKDVNKDFKKVNEKIVDFLDVSFNLTYRTYKPYRKPNNDPVYINKHCSHRTNIINEVPKAISKRLASIFCTKNVFHGNIGIYIQH